MNKPQKYTATIASKDLVAKTVYVSTLTLADGIAMPFEAGQNVMLDIAPDVKRTMSIASPPSDPHTILLCYDVSPMGPGSRWMLATKVGDTVNYFGPMGIFRLDSESKRRKVFVATGSGIAPFRAMILDYLSNGGTDAVMLYWGLRHEEDIYWLDEWTKLAQQYPNFRFILTLSQPSDSWQGTGGRVTAHVTQEEKDLVNSDFYLCGGKAMVEEIRGQLRVSGVPEAQIKTELFFG